MRKFKEIVSTVVIIVSCLFLAVLSSRVAFDKHYIRESAKKTCLENGYSEIESVKTSAGINKREFYCVKRTLKDVSVCSLEDVLSNSCQ